jgi:uncharacterized protein YecE (DUF72 family)
MAGAPRSKPWGVRASRGFARHEPHTDDVRVGLCGFTISMRTYADDFPVVEVQRTFYDPPTDAAMRKWLAAAGPALECTMKVWQLVTHPAGSPTYRRMKRPLQHGEAPGYFRDSPAVREGWERSVQCADVLSATAMLFQCPASFTPVPDNVERMRRFFERVERPRARLLWEPRGRAWTAQRDLAVALCRDLDLVHVVDPFVTPPAATGSVYWRLHGPGSARASYDDAALGGLRDMLDDVGAGGPAYVMFNNLPRVGDARRFQAMV